MMHPNNSGYALRIILKFCTMKRAKRYMQNILFFSEKSPLVLMGHFADENGHNSSQFWIPSKNFVFNFAQ